MTSTINSSPTTNPYSFQSGNNNWIGIREAWLDDLKGAFAWDKWTEIFGRK